MPRQEDEMIDKQVRKLETLEERLEKTRSEIIGTFKRRKESEKEFLEIIKKQKEYWEGRLKDTDPQKNKKRYSELEEKIKNEEMLIRQINEELDRIDEELEQERVHREQEQKKKK
jgi:2,3-bisphosphoglycerate-independent phosphoglycerate mutase